MALEIMADETGTTGMMVEEQRYFLRVISGKQDVPVGARYQDGLQVQRWMQELIERYSLTCLVCLVSRL